ncbi:MAG: trehalose-6-phosphate synthase, partial [Pseudomonadota bacterium]
MSTHSGRLVIVSNRVAVPDADKPAAGGLAVGVLAALKEHGGMWFGWNGELTGSEPSDPDVERIGNIDYATISLNADDYEKYYNGYSNKVLWPVCHYLLDFIQYDAADFDGYLRVNTLFARKLAPMLEPDDVIWVHDYHLIPLAAELRAAGIENRIGFFLHVPFPAFEALRAAPGHEYLLRSLCAYDVLGFHTPRDLAAFRSCVREPIVGAEIVSEHVIRAGTGTFIADVFPIGIDVDEIAEMSAVAHGMPE